MAVGVGKCPFRHAVSCAYGSFACVHDDVTRAYAEVASSVGVTIHLAGFLPHCPG